jgi:hypothetical protein
MQRACAPLVPGIVGQSSASGTGPLMLPGAPLTALRARQHRCGAGRPSTVAIARLRLLGAKVQGSAQVAPTHAPGPRSLPPGLSQNGTASGQLRDSFGTPWIGRGPGGVAGEAMLSPISFRNPEAKY